MKSHVGFLGVEGLSFGVGFKVLCSGCMVHGAWCRFQGSGCRMHDTWCMVQDAGRRVQIAGCRVQGVGCRVHGAGCSAGCRVQGQVVDPGPLDIARLQLSQTQRTFID